MQWGFNPVAGVNDFAGDRASLEFLSIPREQTKAFAHCDRLDEFESCQSARKKDPLSASKRDPFAEQRDRYDGRSIRAGRGVGRA